jgi:N-acylglucosamine 2-epimerase
LDRYGKIKRGTESIFTDHFVLEALCEFAVATKTSPDYPLIRETYDSIEKRVYDPDLIEFARFNSDPRFMYHGVYMISLHVAEIAKQVLEAARTRPLIDHCLEQILYIFAKDDYGLLFESVARDGKIVTDDKQGRLINPGHAFESMWFCIEKGRRRGDRSIIDRAIKIADWTYRKSYDHEFGGILTFLDSSGIEPNYPDWLKERNLLWHDKVWWVQAEALYTLALMALEKNSDEYFSYYIDLHNWCQKNFNDPKYGEWYLLLHRNGTPKITIKGGMQKAAYHLPRALMMIMMLFEAYKEGC